jgi:hypothetical protein
VKRKLLKIAVDLMVGGVLLGGKEVEFVAFVFAAARFVVVGLHRKGICSFTSLLA